MLNRMCWILTHLAMLGLTSFATAQVRELHVEYIDAQHNSSPIGSSAVRVPGNDLIPLKVVLQPVPPSPLGQGERLIVHCDTWEPAYAAAAPPANISFAVRNMKGEAVPFKICSSGGGFDRGRLYAFMDLDIIGDPAVHSAKLREVAARMLGKGSKEAAPDRLWENPELVDRGAQVLEQAMGVYTPPGTYEVTAEYRSKSGETVVSEAARFVVFDPGDPAAKGRSN
jgi:hypothetical protein